MREQIQNLIESNITAYRVAKDTNITLYSIQKLFNGESKIDNITLKNAEILSKYWEENKMKQTFEKVLQAVEGKIDNEHGVAYYTNVAEFLEVTGKESVEGLSSWKDNKLTDEFDGSFIAYDYLNSDFTFLTSTEESEVNTFIERITAK